MSDRFFALTYWSAPWREQFKVVKMSASESLSGIGWVSFEEYSTYKAALFAKRIAKRLMLLGLSPDEIQVMFNSTV